MSKLVILWRCTENGVRMRFVRDGQGFFRFQIHIRNKDKKEWSNLDRVPSGYIGNIEEALAATVFKVKL